MHIYVIILSNPLFSFHFILSVNGWYFVWNWFTEACSLNAIKTRFLNSLSIIFCYLLSHWYDRNYHYHSSLSLCYRDRKSLLMYMSAKSNFSLQKLYLDENVVSIALQKEIFPSVWLYDIKSTWVQNVVSLVNNVC